MISLDQGGRGGRRGVGTRCPRALGGRGRGTWILPAPDEAAAARWRVVADPTPHVILHRSPTAGRCVAGGGRPLPVGRRGPARAGLDGRRPPRGGWAHRRFTRLPAPELTDRGVRLDDLFGAEGAALTRRLEDAPDPAGGGRRRARLPRPEAVATARIPDWRVRGLMATLAGGARLHGARGGPAARASPRGRCATRCASTSASGRRPCSASIASCGRSRAMRRGAGGNDVRGALAVGYADHAHFVHECRALLGETPRRFLDRAGRDGRRFLQDGADLRRDATRSWPQAPGWRPRSSATGGEDAEGGRRSAAAVLAAVCFSPRRAAGRRRSLVLRDRALLLPQRPLDQPAPLPLPVGAGGPWAGDGAGRGAGAGAGAARRAGRRPSERAWSVRARLLPGGGRGARPLRRRDARAEGGAPRAARGSALRTRRTTSPASPPRCGAAMPVYLARWWPGHDRANRALGGRRGRAGGPYEDGYPALRGAELRGALAGWQDPRGRVGVRELAGRVHVGPADAHGGLVHGPGKPGPLRDGDRLPRGVPRRPDPGRLRARRSAISSRRRAPRRTGTSGTG